MKTQEYNYHDLGETLRGFLAFEDSKQQRPAVLVAHDWGGCNQFARDQAQKLAELGYVGFAIDMYGEGRTGETKEQKSALMEPLYNNRQQLVRRMNAAYTSVKQLTMVDRKKIAAIGFCFGGLCVLDLARSGAELQGVVGFHGLLNPPSEQTSKKIPAKVLVLHGYDDPMVPPEQVKQFAEEMTNAQADWQINMYGNTMHAFTNPAVNDASFGTVYNKLAAERAWQAMSNFLAEIFRDG